ncbi:MAG: SprT family zinc-dependent metalloprotease [Candidatus Sericytochromatia bacterium]
MIETININGIDIKYEIKLVKRLKNIYIQIDNNEIVVLKTSKTNLTRAKQLLFEKINWINKKLSKIKEDKAKNQDKEDKLVFLGKLYNIKLEVKSTNDYFFDENVFNVFINNKNLDTKETVISSCKDHFYKLNSMKIIPEKVKFWSEKMNLAYKSISFRKMKNCWGSCSSKNDLLFNSHIAKLDYEAIDYIIIHELSHIKEKNHSKNFWALVEKYCANYKEINKRIKSQNIIN